MAHRARIDPADVSARDETGPAIDHLVDRELATLEVPGWNLFRSGSRSGLRGAS